MRRGCILFIAMPSVAVDGMIEPAEPVRKLLCGEVEGIQMYFKHLYRSCGGGMWDLMGLEHLLKPGTCLSLSVNCLRYVGLLYFKKLSRRLACGARLRVLLISNAEKYFQGPWRTQM